MKILVLDTETTGLDITKNEIIQIGFLLVEHNEDKNTILEKKQINIAPMHIETAHPVALKINGYNEKDWQGSKTIIFHLKEIREKIENADLLLGQNLIFDLRFIKQAFVNCDVAPPKFPKYFDTKSIASGLVKEGKMKSTSLDNMCKHFNILFNGAAHTALVDCERTFLVWSKLMQENKNLRNVKFYSFEDCYDPYSKR